MKWNREIVAWSLYDFANSAFATTILGVIFPFYFTQRVVGHEGADLFGMSLSGASLWGYAVGISMFLVFVTAPVLGAISDHFVVKKKILFCLCFSACLLTGMIYFVKQGDYILGAGLFIFANFGFAAGNALYNAFLPELANEKEIGRVSGIGWAFGYVGGGLCLVLNLLMKESPGTFFLPETDDVPVRAAMVTVGLWWAVFSIPFFLWVRDRAQPRAKIEGKSYVQAGYSWVLESVRHFRRYPELAKFLLAYLLYNDGIETVILMATIFGATALGMPLNELILCFLMIQAVATVGSLLFGNLADRIGHKKSILITLCIYLCIVIWATVMKSRSEFWILGAIVGLILGGSQAASRSLLALMSPKERMAEFYGFFALAGKLATVFGPVLFAVVNQMAGIRAAVFSLSIFFVFGGGILLFVREEEGIQQARMAIG